MEVVEFYIKVAVSIEDILSVQEQIQEQGVECSFKLAKKVLRDIIRFDSTRTLNELVLFGDAHCYLDASDFKETYEKELNSNAWK